MPKRVAAIVAGVLVAVSAARAQATADRFLSPQPHGRKRGLERRHPPRRAEARSAPVRQDHPHDGCTRHSETGFDRTDRRDAFACRRDISVTDNSVIGSSQPDLGGIAGSVPKICFANASHLAVLGSTFGSDPAFSANTAGVSIVVEGASDFYRIRDSDFMDGFNAGMTSISDTTKGTDNSIGDTPPEAASRRRPFAPRIDAVHRSGG